MIGLIVFFLTIILYYVSLFLVIRFAFLFIRQIFRILSVRKTFQKLRKNNNLKIDEKRSIFQIIFGNKGDIDYIVTLDGQEYLISIISFIYGKRRFRWHIDKATNNDLTYIEVRFYHGFLYSNYKKASKEPNFSNYYNFETPFERHRLYLDNQHYDEKTKKILLFVSKPEYLTYSDMEFKFINSGDNISGYKVMLIDDLKKSLELIDIYEKKRTTI